MIYQENDLFNFVAKVITINDHNTPVNVDLDLGEQTINVNIPSYSTKIYINQLYHFTGKVIKKDGKDKLYFIVETYTRLDETNHELEEILPRYLLFFPSPKIDILKYKTKIEKKINGFKNEKLKSIVSLALENYKTKYFLNPAGVRLHHNYLGGLVKHSYTMLELAEKIVKVYPFLNEDLLVSGVLLHDLAKVLEISGVGGEYTTEGQLLGHIYLGAELVDRLADLLKIRDSEEVRVLKHMIISHHGIPAFGAIKKPQIAEGIVLWLVDTLDSKLSVAGEELLNLVSGEFSQPLQVLDKVKLYKPKF